MRKPWPLRLLLLIPPLQLCACAATPCQWVPPPPPEAVLMAPPDYRQELIDLFNQLPQAQPTSGPPPPSLVPAPTLK